MRKVVVTLSAGALMVLTLGGWVCDGTRKELPDGTGYRSETSGRCDDGDATNGPPTQYTPINASRSCRDALTEAKSQAISFQQLIGTANAILSQHSTAAIDARSFNKAFSTLQVTKAEQVTCSIDIQLSPNVQGVEANATIFVWLKDNNGQLVPGTNHQIKYNVKPNPQNPRTQQDVSRDGQLVTTIANPGNYQDSQPQWTVNLQPGIYTVQFELNVDARADPIATLLATGTAKFN